MKAHTTRHCEIFGNFFDWQLSWKWSIFDATLYPHYAKSIYSQPRMYKRICLPSNIVTSCQKRTVNPSAADADGNKLW